VFDPKSSHMGFVVITATLRQVFFEHVGFPCQFSLHQRLRVDYSSYHGRCVSLATDRAPSNKLDSRVMTAVARKRRMRGEGGRPYLKDSLHYRNVGKALV
jgi:hypothetical protein